MKFLCTKVKKDWLTVPDQAKSVEENGLIIKSPFIGVEINGSKPTKDEVEKVERAIDNLFGNHKIAFPIKLLEF